MRPLILAVLAFFVAAGPLAAAEAGRGALTDAVNAPLAREAIARVVHAEAAGQGDAGLAAVVFTILNRLESGAWGASVDAVLNARAQFEPVLRAGGDWRGLPPATASQKARIDTILNLALEGKLPDLTGGARYFQNPAIVAQRVQAGTVAPSLVHFGGATPSAVIGDHAFYVSTARGDRAGRPRPDPYAAAGGDIFVAPAPVSVAKGEAALPAAHPGERGLFVLSDGQVVVDTVQVP